MLTAEQKAIRKTGVGASEVSALVELNPYKDAMAVWCRKPTPSRPPLVDDDDDDDGEENPRAEVGSVLEGSLRELYTRRTGIELAPYEPITLRHPDLEHVLASPDGLSADGAGGLELKVVGANMLHHWEGGVPDYVVAQCTQNMAVVGRDRWDVAALLGGTDFRVWSIGYDDDLATMLLEACEEFWTVHVEGDTPPEPRDHESRKAYLRARYPSASSKCVPVGDGDHGELADLARMFAEGKELLANVQAAHDQIEAYFQELVGDQYGIEGGWGKFLWYGVRGRVDWKAVAEELAGGVVPLALEEKHRGKGYRVPRFYPLTEKAAAKPRAKGRR